MNIPRNLNGKDFARKLTKLGYEFVRQRGSHYLVRTTINGKQTLSIPMHKPIKTATLHRLLKDVARHHNLSMEKVILVLDL
jgi:predicted RNA binding protein YcfA (HicA-like mRNA interferase family)